MKLLNDKAKELKSALAPFAPGLSAVVDAGIVPSTIRRLSYLLSGKEEATYREMLAGLKKADEAAFKEINRLEKSTQTFLETSGRTDDIQAHQARSLTQAKPWVKDIRKWVMIGVSVGVAVVELINKFT